MRTIFSSTSLLLAGLILAAAASAVDPVYKWKDSAGHSHYSQTPPEGQKYQTINPAATGISTNTSTPVTGSMPAGGAAAATPVSEPTPAQVARQKLCDTARNNVQVLANQPVVEMDVYNSGKAQRLTPAQQAQQLDKAQQQVQALCAK